MSKTIVITSGGFDPIHRGHIEYLTEASSLGDYHISILNNDNFLVQKKGKPFMSLEDRKAVLENIVWVDEVFISIDTDMTVCESLKAIRKKYPKHKLIFAKGGDRTSEEIPESKVCEELGIEIIDGLGEKIQSSSEIIKKWENN